MYGIPRTGAEQKGTGKSGCGQPSKALDGMEPTCSAAGSAHANSRTTPRTAAETATHRTSRTNAERNLAHQPKLAEQRLAPRASERRLAVIAMAESRHYSEVHHMPSDPASEHPERFRC